MMREMSSRDKMILLIITVIIILAVGFFALVRPKYNTMMADKAACDDARIEWEGIESKINEIPVLKESITAEYKDASETAEIFINEAFEPVNETFDNRKFSYVLDQYIQPMIDETELKVSSISLGELSAEAIEYYYYTPNVLTYALLENADINGNYAQEVDDLLKESNTISQKQTVSLMASNVDLSLTGTKEQLMNFLTRVKEDENAVLVNSVAITDYTFGEGQTRTETYEVTAEDGTVTVQTREVPVAADGQGESDMSISLTFYNAMPIDEPILGD